MAPYAVWRRRWITGEAPAAEPTGVFFAALFAFLIFFTHVDRKYTPNMLHRPCREREAHGIPSAAEGAHSLYAATPCVALTSWHDTVYHGMTRCAPL